MRGLLIRVLVPLEKRRLMETEQSHIEAKDVLEQLFEKRKRFERFAVLYVRDAEVARDIMMDSFKYLLEHIEGIDTTGNMEAYMFRVVKNKCLDWLQREQIRQTAESVLQRDAEFEIEMRIATLRAFDPDWLYNAELRARIKRAVNRLPEKTRKVFIMSRHDEKTYQEISEALDVSVKTVEFHISKALLALRTELGDTAMMCLFVCLLLEI